MKHRILIFLIIAVFLALLIPVLMPSATEAAGPNNDHGYVTYVVKRGDTLSSIGRTFCTSWQAIYSLNQHIIGSDPDHLRAGMVLTVPANCNGGACYDRGLMPHAQGSLSYPNYYWVIRGDTWYSIGKRFGVSVSALRQANGLQYPLAYRMAVIPFAFVGPAPVPPPQPTPPTTPTPPPVQQSYLTITEPPANATLTGTTFTVRGRGGNLHEANVVVRVKDMNGAMLAEQTTVLQGPDVGTGGEGDWSVQFNLSNPPADITIEATSPGTSALASVRVHFQSNNGNIDYPAGQCTINIKAGADAYETPGGRVFGTFTNSAVMGALSRTTYNNEFWYKVLVPTSNTSQTPVWLPYRELTSVGPGC